MHGHANERSFKMQMSPLKEIRLPHEPEPLLALQDAPADPSAPRRRAKRRLVLTEAAALEAKCRLTVTAAPAPNPPPSPEFVYRGPVSSGQSPPRRLRKPSSYPPAGRGA